MEEKTATRLTDSELKVMEVLWTEGPCSAKYVAEVLSGRLGWNVNSTYTLLKRCIGKGAVSRTDPGFVCTPLVTREAVRCTETEKLLDKLFDGSADLLFAALLRSERVTKQQLEQMRQQLEELEE